MTEHNNALNLDNNGIEIIEHNPKELNAFKYDYMPLSYWKNWFTNISQFFRNIKWAWQRATKGYCDRDTFNLDSYYLQLFYHTIKHLAKNTHGWPGNWSLEGETFEDWQKYLSDMADHFENALEWNEDELSKEDTALFEKMLSYISSSDCVPVDGCKYYKQVEKYSDEEKYNKARDEWLKKNQEVYDYRVSERNLGLDMMKEVFGYLWD